MPLDWEVEEIKEELRRKPKKEMIPIKDLLGTGCTLLNLACTGKTNGGFAKGKYFFFVGDSTSGKTWLTLTCLAEASINPEFDDYRFIYDNGEDGALMDMRHFFGKAMAKRLEPPAFYEDDTPAYSERVEDFYDNVRKAIKKGEPFIYILDSMDSLSSEAEQKKLSKQQRARGSGEKAAGSYTDNKAKVNSSNLRSILQGLRRTGSILIIINQSRDSLGFGFDTKTYSGGHALKFYATLQLWTSIVKRLKKPVKKMQRQIGIICRVKIKKNRITGRERTVDIPIYHSYGIDDLGANIDYLVREGHWKKSQGGINAHDFNFKGKRESLIHHIEEEDLEKELRGVVSKVWHEIEEASSIQRKRRY